MNIPGGWELILVVLVIMVLFGAKRLPDSARALGRSMRILKAETKGLRDDDNDVVVAPGQGVTPTPPPAASPVVSPSPTPVVSAEPTEPPRTP